MGERYQQADGVVVVEVVQEEGAGGDVARRTAIGQDVRNHKRDGAHVRLPGWRRGAGAAGGLPAHALPGPVDRSWADVEAGDVDRARAGRALGESPPETAGQRHRDVAAATGNVHHMKRLPWIAMSLQRHRIGGQHAGDRPGNVQ